MLPNQQLLFGVPFDALRMEEVIFRCRNALVTRSQIMLGMLNAAKIVNMRSDPLLRNSLMECDLLLADGQAIVWASKLLRHPLPERITGIDLFENLLALAHAEGRSVYLLGARPEILAALETNLRARFDGLRIVGSHHGYFDPADSERIATEIRDSSADMLFIGMVSPKKETFLAAFGERLGVPILHGVGGSFDIMAGLTKRAPLAWQRYGMEWAFRVLQEPRRLWRRYLSTNTAFILLTIKELVAPSRAIGKLKASARQAMSNAMGDDAPGPSR